MGATMRPKQRPNYPPHLRPSQNEPEELALNAGGFPPYRFPFASMCGAKLISFSLEVGCRAAAWRRCTGLCVDLDVQHPCCLHPERYSRNHRLARPQQEH